MSRRSDRRFLMTDLLSILRDSDSKTGISEDEIRRKMMDAIATNRASDVDWPYPWDGFPYWLEKGGTHLLLRSVLYDLASVGLLEGELTHGPDRPEQMLWRVDRGWFKSRPLPESELADGGDEMGPPPIDGDDEGGGGDGDRGAGGLGDVLAHPFLFAVGDDDLEAAVLAAMGGAE